MTLDYYGRLDVAPDASRFEIRMAFRALALRYHPDVHPDRSAAVETFRTIIEAYEVLSNPGKRASYDEWRRLEALHPGQSTFAPPSMGGIGPRFTGG